MQSCSYGSLSFLLISVEYVVIMLLSEDETVGWHPWLNEQEAEQAPGVGDGQGSLCAGVRGAAQSDAAERLNSNSDSFVMCEPVTFCLLSVYGQSG